MDIFWRIVIVAVVLLALLVGYNRYGDQISVALFGQSDAYTMYVDKVAFSVSIADTPDERRQGLSGTPALGTYEGKLFIFDETAKHGIWMKDMNYALDILWFDENFTLIHIEENVTPETFPKVFAPREPARYVLEINAFSARTLGLELGQRLILPTGFVPAAAVQNLQ